MSEAIFDPRYWHNRNHDVVHRGKPEHHKIFISSQELWDQIRERHRLLIRRNIWPKESVLDAGCGYGRFLSELIYDDWEGRYLGVDLSPDFIRQAKDRHPGREFVLADLRDFTATFPQKYDWGVLVSIKNMVLTHSSEEHWNAIEKNLKRYCERLLVLEYDLNHNGEIL